MVDMIDGSFVGLQNDVPRGGLSGLLTWVVSVDEHVRNLE